MLSSRVNVLLVLCVAAFLVFVSVDARGHECIHDLIMSESGILHTKKRGIQAGGNQAPQQYATPDLPTATNSQPLRINVDYSFFGAANDPGYTCGSAGETVTAFNPSTGSGVSYTCTAADVLSASATAYLQGTLIPQATATLSGGLSVVPVQNQLTLNSLSCALTLSGLNIPSGTQIADTDVNVYITIRPILGGSVLAFGGECQWDQFFRPVAGQLNFNPSVISTDPGQHDMQLGTAIHEHSHLLGFSFGNFEQLKNGPSSFYNALQQVTSNHLANNQPITIYRFTGPTVTSWVQEYFSCGSLNGADIEDQGAPGTALSHWKKRVFMNEYMTGEASMNPVFSGLTLSMFQDSGWYYANMSAAVPLQWGYQMGCSFVQDACTSWPVGTGYFCEPNSADACSFDRSAKAYCAITGNSIPSAYQYFGDGTTGGTDALSDFCPIPIGYSNGYCVDATNQQVQVLPTGETFGEGSRCYESTLVKNLPTSSQSLVCYLSECASSTLLKVKLDNIFYDCSEAGQSLYAIDYGGSLTCPDPGAICSGYPTDDNWPIFNSISPTSGEPGSTVTIFGDNFQQGATVYMSGWCTNVIVWNWTTITATTPAYQNILNYGSLIDTDVYVVVFSADKTKTDAARNAYNFDIKLDQNLLNGAGAWITVHWYVVVIAGVVLIILIAICVKCCCCKKKEESYGYNGKG